MQPTGIKLREVLLPILAKMGVASTYKILNQGLFPDVMGSVETKITALKQGESLKPINLTSKQGETKVDLYISCTQGKAKEFYENVFKKSLKFECNIIEEDAGIVLPKKAKASVFSCDAIVRTGEIAVACDLILEGQYDNSQHLIDQFQEEVIELVESLWVVVDEHTCDQLIIYMALAEGQSVIQTGELSKKSKHTLT